MVLDNKKDRSKIIQIYEEYYSLMYYTAARILKDHALAEDAVADSIEKLIRNIHKVGEISCYKTRALIVIIVKHTALNIIKKANRSDSLDTQEDEIADTAPLITDEIMSMESFNNLVGIIHSLPDTYREAAVLSLVHGYSHEDISKVLDISYNTVKMRISRAKKSIRNKLGEGREEDHGK